MPNIMTGVSLLAAPFLFYGIDKPAAQRAFGIKPDKTPQKTDDNFAKGKALAAPRK